MAKVLSCREAGYDCNFVARGRSEEELWQKVREHAGTVHDLELTAQHEEQLRPLVREE